MTKEFLLRGPVELLLHGPVGWNQLAREIATPAGSRKGRGRREGWCARTMFPAAERWGRRSAIDDNLRAIDDAEAAGYRGLHEVEIFSVRNSWKREPQDVLGLVKGRNQECC